MRQHARTFGPAKGLTLHIDEIVFAIAFACGGLLVLGSSLGVLEIGDLGGDADVDAQTQIDDAADAVVVSALSFGPVPLVILVMMLSLSFGGVGMLVAPVLHASFGTALGALAAFAIASCVALTVTIVGSRALARVLPRTESYAGHKRDLVGLTGRVVSASREGAVIARVIDRGGAEMRITCTVHGGSVQVGDEVAVIAYERDLDCFLIEKTSAR